MLTQHGCPSRQAPPPRNPRIFPLRCPRVDKPGSAIVEMPLEERDDALAVGDALLADAHEQRGRALVLEGPPGIGKTRLLTAIRERAQAAGMRTLRARAGELERDFPFGIVRQLFEASLAGSARAELLSGAAELAGPLFDLRGSGELPAADPAYSTLHGLYWLTVQLPGNRTRPPRAAVGGRSALV